MRSGVPRRLGRGLAPPLPFLHYAAAEGKEGSSMQRTRSRRQAAWLDCIGDDEKDYVVKKEWDELETFSNKNNSWIPGGETNDKYSLEDGTLVISLDGDTFRVESTGVVLRKRDQPM
jgi:hypothetical protein